MVHNNLEEKQGRCQLAEYSNQGNEIGTVCKHPDGHDEHPSGVQGAGVPATKDWMGSPATCKVGSQMA